MSNTELNAKIKEYKELKALQNELQDEISAIEDDIKKIMQDQEELKIMGNVVKWTKLTSSKFDSKTFKAEHSKMYEQYLKTTQSRRFQIA
jgi:predicted phage-related endonuclease